MDKSLLKRCSVYDFSNEQLQSWVDLSEYQIGEYEVTNKQYYQCVKASICSTPANKIYTAKQYELHPVTDVRWYDAKTFCEWVGGHLPTEAEWEKAASWDEDHQTKRIFPWGDGIDCSFANYYGKYNGYTACVSITTPVGSYEGGKSFYSVYDMAGNVWEWTSSLYRPYPYDAKDGREDMSSSDYRVSRGGSWGDGVNSVRSASRYWIHPTSLYYFLGFRCARDVP